MLLSMINYLSNLRFYHEKINLFKITFLVLFIPVNS